MGIGRVRATVDASGITDTFRVGRGFRGGGSDRRAPGTHGGVVEQRVDSRPRTPAAPGTIVAADGTHGTMSLFWGGPQSVVCHARWFPDDHGMWCQGWWQFQFHVKCTPHKSFPFEFLVDVDRSRFWEYYQSPVRVRACACLVVLVIILLGTESVTVTTTATGTAQTRRRRSATRRERG